MPENSEKNCACGGEKRINCELEDYMHAGKVVAPEKRIELAYIVRKGGIIVAENAILPSFNDQTDWSSERRPIRELCYC